MRNRLIYSGIIFGGIVARFSQYLHDRSLWFDEATLALKVTNYSLIEFFNPTSLISEGYMVKYQVAPLGFVILVKWLIQFLGSQEYVLRLIPQAASIASLFLFFQVAKKYLRDFWAIVFSLCIFAFSEYLIYFSAEFKPYAVDVAVALSLYLMFIHIAGRQLNGKQAWIWALLGAIAVWCSFPSVFILVGGGLALLIDHVQQKRRDQLRLLLLIMSVWVLSYCVNYFQYLKPYMFLHSLDTFWRGTYMPTHPFTEHGIAWYGLKWFWYTSIKIFKNPVGLFIPFLGTILSVIGGWSLFKSNRTAFLVLFLPVCLTLGVSAMHKYPFYGRMILFLCPALIIFVGSGFEYLRVHALHKRPLIIWALFAFILIHPITKNVLLTFNPVEREEIKQPMEYFKDHWEKGDVLFVYFAAEYAFRYYQRRFKIENDSVKIGMPLIDYKKFERMKNSDYKSELNLLNQNKRVWVLFSHVYDDDERLFTDHLNKLGKQINVVKAHGASVYLYEFDS